MSEDRCLHRWRVDGLVMDFGLYGIRTRCCEKCGEVQESDPSTGKWRENVEDTDAR